MNSSSPLFLVGEEGSSTSMMVSGSVVSEVAKECAPLSPKKDFLLG